MMKPSLLHLLSTFAAAAAGACGGAGATSIGPGDASPDQASTADSGGSTGSDARVTTEAGLEAGLEAGSTGAVSIHLAATTAPFVHHDGLSGQTPSDQRIGITSLSLGASAADASPWVVFDDGAKAIDAGMNDGDDTLVTRVPSAALRAGHYAWAKVGVAYVRYAVAATVHTDGLAVPGTFHNLEVLSNGTTIGAQTYASGYYSFAFVVGGMTYGPVTGTSAPLPKSAGLGITLSIVDGKATYGFPVDLAVAGATSDVTLVMLANTNEDFRWMDETKPGYATGVFDVTPPDSYEPVLQFGANSLTLSVKTGG